MNKRELIERMEGLKNLFGNKPEYVETDTVIELISELDEPEKVTIPQYVADWIETAKTVYSLSGGMTFGGPGVNKWLAIDDNQETFARAWLDGYTVEEEKKYKITLLNRNDGDLYLVNQNADLADKYGHFSPVVLLFTKCTNFSKKCYELTKKEVIAYDFGWVFDCPGIKIEEAPDGL